MLTWILTLVVIILLNQLMMFFDMRKYFQWVANRVIDELTSKIGNIKNLEKESTMKAIFYLGAKELFSENLHDGLLSLGDKISFSRTDGSSVYFKPGDITYKVTGRTFNYNDWEDGENSLNSRAVSFRQVLYDLEKMD